MINRKDEHLVSVIIPCFNSNKTLPRALASVLAQTYQNWEIILIDDASSALYQSKFNDPRIRLFRNEINLGPGASRQKGFEVSKGEMICFLDSDDILSRDKISNQVELLRNTPNAICVCRTKVFKRMDDLLSIDLLPEIDSDALSFSSNPLDFQLNLLGYLVF